MKKGILVIILLFTIQVSFGQDCLNVDFKLRGYFYAGTSITDTLSAGGFYADKNIPKKINGSLPDKALENNFRILVLKDSIAEFKDGIAGFKVFVINTTDSVVELSASDSRLNLKRQVFYKNKWRDIEYLPSSWCGNSYHNVYIKPDEYWDFTAPCLQGKIDSTFRFILFVNYHAPVFSNEFDGSFNKKQLKKEQGYNPTGIMDPYDR